MQRNPSGSPSNYWRQINGFSLLINKVLFVRQGGGGGGGRERDGVEGRYNLTFGVWRELLAAGAEYNGFPGFSDILLPMNSADPKSQSLPRHLSPWRQTIMLPLLTSWWSMRSGWKQ